MCGPCCTSVDGSPAVFKTVCGALLRRPGWVRFPSIPATFSGDDSQDDSRRRQRACARRRQPNGWPKASPQETLRKLAGGSSLQADVVHQRGDSRSADSRPIISWLRSWKLVSPRPGQLGSRAGSSSAEVVTSSRRGRCVARSLTVNSTLITKLSETSTLP